MNVSDKRLSGQILQTPPTVVRLRIKGGAIVQNCDVYIGRQQTQGGWNLPTSVWHNPYKVRECKSVDDACRRYEKNIRADKQLMLQIPLLYGKRLGCWCIGKPKCTTCGKPNNRRCGHYQCHGEVLIKIACEMLKKQTTEACEKKESSEAEWDALWRDLDMC